MERRRLCTETCCSHFLTFPEQAGPQAVSGELQSVVPCGSGRSPVLDIQEDAQSRTMNWLMQSPVQAEAGSGSVLEGTSVTPHLCLPWRWASQRSCQTLLLTTLNVSTALMHTLPYHQFQCTMQDTCLLMYLLPLANLSFQMRLS